MKKYITLFTFVCVLFLGIQTATAQETVELKAKNRTIKLKTTLELNSAQIKQVYKIFLKYEEENSTENASALNDARKKISELLRPEQRSKFDRTYEKERKREEKLSRGANGGQ